ncbi:hypothetical protein ADL35_12700, partial [Streptomyces sp. NRRL WC-3753]
RDLDVVRAGLGERKLTFMGASYGSYFGALYAKLFPSHVRRMVFDSAVDPSPSRVWYRNNMAQSAAFEKRWADFRRWIASHDAAYGMGGAPLAVRTVEQNTGLRIDHYVEVNFLAFVST